MTKNHLTGLMTACAFSVFMSACGGGGGDKAPTDPLAYPVSNREPTYIDADPRTPARIAFDHLSFAARTAAMPWGWLPVSAQRYACTSASESMAVTRHANSTPEQPLAEYTLIDSNACSFTPFQHFSGYWRGDTPYIVNWANSPLVDEMASGSAAFAFDVVRGNGKRQSMVFGALNYVVHKDASGLTIDVTTPGSITQDQSATPPYPQLQISGLALHLDERLTGDLLGSVSGHFTFSDGTGYSASQNGTVTINVPISFSGDGDGASAGKMTITQTNGRVTVMSFSGTGHGNVRVTSATNATSAAIEVYNGTVDGLLSNF